MSDWVKDCRHAAAMIVCGVQQNPVTKRAEPASGQWGPAWLEHGLVRQSVREGWARDLRMFARLAVTRRVMEITKHTPSQMPRFEDVVRDVDDFLPKDREWIQAARDGAERDQLAAEYRNAKSPRDTEATDRIVAAFKRDPSQAMRLLVAAMGGKPEPEKKRALPDVSRAAFDRMHQEKQDRVNAYLSEQTRRMTGERDE